MFSVRNKQRKTTHPSDKGNRAEIQRCLPAVTVQTTRCIPSECPILKKIFQTQLSQTVRDLQCHLHDCFLYPSWAVSFCSHALQGKANWCNAWLKEGLLVTWKTEQMWQGEDFPGLLYMLRCENYMSSTIVQINPVIWLHQRSLLLVLIPTTDRDIFNFTLAFC